MERSSSSAIPATATGRKPLVPGVVWLHQAVTEGRAGPGLPPPELPAPPGELHDPAHGRGAGGRIWVPCR